MKIARLRLPDNLRQKILAFEIAGESEDGFDPLVVKRRALDKFLLLWIVRPAGQRAGGFGDVFFRVMSLAERKQFHDFTRKIFVGMILAALRLIQIEKHCGVFADFNEQTQPVVGGEAAEQFILPPHQVDEFGVPRIFSMLVAKWPCQNKTIFS